VGRPNLARRALAEGLAAFALVFAGCGAIVANAVYEDALGTIGVALVFGLVIMAMVYATGHPPISRRISAPRSRPSARGAPSSTSSC
jgi:glycerol uptake facilitator-like aquaporin